MNIIAVAGMPGSGKSNCMKEYVSQGYERIDDLNKDWQGNLEKLKKIIAQGGKAIVSDIEFCGAGFR